MELTEINTKTKEGQLLVAALAKLTTESQRDKTPFEVLDQLEKLQEQIYNERTVK